MAKAVKLADIAEKVNVSTVTVSKALSNQKGVSEELRARIKELADEMGYKQPSVIRKERAQKSYNIGIIISEVFLGKYDSFYWQMYQMVTTKASAKGCFTLLEVITNEAAETNQIPMLLQEQKVDGLIVIGRQRERYLQSLEKNSNVPMVYLDFCNEHEDCDAIISDSYYGAYKLTNYLFEMGHRKIAYVGTLKATGSITDRYFGYCKSMLEHGFTVHDDWVIPDRDPSNDQIDPENLMQLPEDMPTAFVCNCDLCANELIHKLEGLGYRVPEDISVVGYDNYLFPGLSDIAITTYEVDLKEMARRGVNILIKKMNGDPYHKGISIVEGHLVVKDSVKNLNKIK